jgi:hypothetical protein
MARRTAGALLLLLVVVAVAGVAQAADAAVNE